MLNGCSIAVVPSPEDGLRGRDDSKDHGLSSRSAQGDVALMMSLSRHDDLMILADLVSADFGVPRNRLFDRCRHRQVMLAKRFLCLFAHEACGVSYPRLSRFLRLSRDGARKLALSAGDAILNHVVVWAKMEAAFKIHVMTKRGGTNE